jgi:glycosyltransferase involved in cell wall biosynthesis
LEKIDIIIATRNRFTNLIQTISSIPTHDYIRIIVVCDGDLDTFRRLDSLEKGRNIKVLLVPSHKGSVFCRNLGVKLVEDGVLFSTDCTIFHLGSIERALNIFNNNFVDNDGVLGFGFQGRGSCTAVSLIGKTFLDRYPNKEVFYPGFFHFACQEISALCQKLEGKYGKKFLYVDYENTITKNIIKDSTYKDARLNRSSDFLLKEQRENQQIVWGEV